MNRSFCFILVLSLTGLASEDPLPRASLHAEENREKPPLVPGFEFSNPRTYQLSVNVQVSAPGNYLSKVLVTSPLPSNWPEQKIELIDTLKPAGTRISIKTFPGQAEMLQLQFPGIPAGSTATVQRIYRITRFQMKFTLPTEQLRIPQKPNRSLRIHLGGAPGIELRNGHLLKLQKELVNPDLTAWKQAKTYYMWIRKHIKYQQGAFRGAAKTWEKKEGDCEDLTALFIVLCRLTQIPARSVWIEGHAYAEFYLEDAAGTGYWIPAELTGPLWFGKTGQYGPILQKGDRFTDPFARKSVRYVPQSARAFGGAARLNCTRIIQEDK